MKPGEAMGRVLRVLLILPPIAIGALVLAYIIAGREPPARLPPEERVQPVRVVTVPELAVIPRARGHGVVQPGRVWEAVAEVPGRVVEEHPRLERGAVVDAGDVLLRLDPSDYELRVAQAEAAIEALEARRAELDLRAANHEASLVIERRALELGEAELERQRTLLARGTIAQATVDQEERRVLGLRLAVQGLENQVSLIPAERRVLQAELRQRRAELEAARLNLERTVIRLPFDARISQVNVRTDQFAGQGQVLAVADGLESAEIVAQLAMEHMPRLVREDIPPITVTPETVRAVIEELGLEAVVRLRAGGIVATWAGRVDRISETVDPQTRTVGVIVVVDRPYDQVVPGRRPPLVKNMFVEVELRGRPAGRDPVVPRDAVHGGRVHVVGADDRLEIRPVRVAFEQGEIAVIASGLAGGERVVIGDLVPAIEGMRLAPAHDDEALEMLLREADGRDDTS